MSEQAAEIHFFRSPLGAALAGGELSAQIATSVFAKWSIVLAMRFAFCYLHWCCAQEGRGE